MGARTWMLVYSDSDVPEVLASRPALDRERAIELARKLFPADTLELGTDGDLSMTSPPGRDVYVACYADVGVVAAEEFAVDFPSKLPARFLERSPSKRVVLHAMHGSVDWFAYAIWESGRLVRSLSLSPESGLIEDLGTRVGFETEYWAGLHPAIDSEDDGPDELYPLPFHPLELAEAALAELFGYVLEGPVERGRFCPEELPMVSFHRAKGARRWAFWRRQ